MWIYVPDGPGSSGPGKGLSPASFDYPILQTYVDVCVIGALEYGREFALEFGHYRREYRGVRRVRCGQGLVDVGANGDDSAAIDTLDRRIGATLLDAGYREQRRAAAVRQLHAEIIE